MRNEAGKIYFSEYARKLFPAQFIDQLFKNALSRVDDFFKAQRSSQNRSERSISPACL